MARPTISKFLRGYVEAALFSTNDESTPSGGRPLDDTYSIDDVDDDTLARMAHECAAFQCQVESVLQWCDADDEQAGRDFWFTRNGHGVGYWETDRGYDAERGEYLTRVANAYGEVNLCAGPDGVNDGR